MISLQQLAQDARFALRTLRRIPAFTTAVVLTLALGIGMTSAVFSVFHAVLLKPLAYPHPERLLWLSMSNPERPSPMEIVLAPDFVNWKEQATSFEELVAYDLSDDPVIVGDAATQERIAWVSEGFWELSGVLLAHGRSPATGERDTVLVSYSFFEERLDGDAAAIGKRVTVDGSPHTIVGVLPRGFQLQLPWPGWPGFEPRDVAAYRTVHIEAPRSNRLQMLNVVGKMKPGVLIDEARAELEMIRRRAALANPEYPGNRMTLRVVPLSQRLSGEGGRALGVLLSAVLLVLLIACANVSGLLLARASARQKEMAIRAAVGAGRARLVRQLIVESLILALVGGAAGLLLARAGLSVILTLVPYAIPRLVESSIDGAVLVFTLVAALVTTFIFGVGPALALGRVNLQDALKLGAKPSSSLSMHPRARRLVVAAEMTLAVVLLTGAGLLIKSFWLITAHPPGFDPAHVLTMKVQFSGPRYDENSRRRVYIDELLRKAAVVPGVAAAGISTHGDTRSVALVEGAPILPPQEARQRSSVFVSTVSAGSARALGMRLLHGRWISDDDPVTNVVVNESLVRRDFAGEAAVGRRIRLHSPETPYSTIVGVISDLKYAKLDVRPVPEVYVPYSSEPPGGFTAIVRTSVDPIELIPAMRTALSDIDRALPVYDMQTLEQALADSIAPRRFNLFLLTVFATAALGLALIGTYGVTAYSVAQREHEIGIRMALGANRRDVVSMVVRQGIGMSLVGIIVGVIAATLLTRVMANLLYDVRPTDPLTFAIAAVGLTLTALTASLVPALRAARIDPSETLR